MTSPEWSVWCIDAGEWWPERGQDGEILRLSKIEAEKKAATIAKWMLSQLEIAVRFEARRFEMEAPNDDN